MDSEQVKVIDLKEAKELRLFAVYDDGKIDEVGTMHLKQFFEHIESESKFAALGRAAVEADEKLKSRSQLVKDILSNFKDTMQQAKDMDTSPAVIRLVEHVHTSCLESVIKRLIEAETELLAGKVGE